MKTKKQTYLALLLPIFLAACDNGNPTERLQVSGLPPEGFIGDAMQGKALYRQFCSACHGINALGNSKGPALVENIYRPSHHADITFHWAASRGVKQHHWRFGDMDSLPGITPEQVGHIISFVRLAQQRAGIQ